jgi:hypothetical protein
MDQTKRPLLIPPEFSTYAEEHGIFDMYKVCDHIARLETRNFVSRPNYGNTYNTTGTGACEGITLYIIRFYDNAYSYTKSLRLKQMYTTPTNKKNTSLNCVYELNLF